MYFYLLCLQHEFLLEAQTQDYYCSLLVIFVSDMKIGRPMYYFKCLLHTLRVLW